MSKKSKMLSPQETVKTALTKLIKNISIIAIGLVLVLVFLSYAGVELKELDAILQWKGSVPSIILLISNIILYELWLKNGQDNGRGESFYKEEIARYEENSKNLHAETMQEFIDWETARREAVEKNKIDRRLSRIESNLANPHISQKVKAKLKKEKDKLLAYIPKVDIPYETSEEFDKLRFSIKDVNPKEYKPGDTNHWLKGNRVKKYTTTATFSLVGFNILSISFTGEWIGAAIMTLIAISIIAMSIVTGFSAGYRSITITDYGVYRTANEFIDKAKAWSAERGVSLYFEEPKFKFSVHALEPIEEDYYRPSIEEAFPEPKGYFQLNKEREIIIE